MPTNPPELKPGTLRHDEIDDMRVSECVLTISGKKRCKPHKGDRTYTEVPSPRLKLIEGPCWLLGCPSCYSTRCETKQTRHMTQKERNC